MTDWKELIERLRFVCDPLMEEAADALEDEQCAVVNADKGSIDIVMAICEETEGEWEPTIAGSYRILEAALSSLNIRQASDVAAEATAKAIEAAKKVCDEMASDHDDGGGKWADPNWCLTRDTAEELSKRINALHTDATRAALAKKCGE